MGYVWIAITVILTAYGQLVLKWRMDQFGHMPDTMREAVLYLGRALLDVYVLSSFAAAFAAALSWMAAITSFEVSFAYPFMSLAFVLVLLLGWLLLGETMSWNRIACVVLIIGGLWLGSR